MWMFAVVSGVAAALGYDVAKDAIDVGEAALVMALVFIVLSQWLSTPAPVFALEEESPQKQFPIGFQPSG
jgi:uncharacterized membrane protein